MSIESILIVLMYSAKPYLWLIVLFVFFPIACYLIKLTPALFNPSQRIQVSVVIGILVALAAPYITTSKLQYVATLTDWATLIGIMVGATLSCWLFLTLLFKDRN